MNIHKTKIEWCSHTWNPVTGCRHDCPYCYARRIATRFGPKIDEFPDESGITAFVNEGVDCYVVEKPTELKDWQGNYRRSTPYPKNFAPTLHKYTLTYPEKRFTPATIFVGSMADLFGRWVPDGWIGQVFDACRRAPRHTYLFLTKNPQRYCDLASAGKLPTEPNFWYGTTITGPDMPFFFWDKANTFVSVEPLLEPFDTEATGDKTLRARRMGNHRSHDGPRKQEAAAKAGMGKGHRQQGPRGGHGGLHEGQPQAYLGRRHPPGAPARHDRRRQQWMSEGKSTVFQPQTAIPSS